MSKEKIKFKKVVEYKDFSDIEMNKISVGVLFIGYCLFWLLSIIISGSLSVMFVGLLILSGIGIFSINYKKKNVYWVEEK